MGIIESNKAFLLYDAMLSLFVLASSILFFNQIILLNQQIQIETSEKLAAIEFMQEQMYLGYLESENEWFKTYLLEDAYCVKENEDGDSFCVSI